MNKDGWKYSKKRLSKYEFCAAIINSKKVICICGKKVKLNRKWDEDYLNRHINGNNISSEEEYNSDICDNIDDDDIITVDSNDNNNNDLDNILSSEDENIQLTIKNTRKRIPCPGLRSQKIRYYIERTSAQVGGTRRIEIIGKELFPSLFSDKFTRKKLNTSQKRKLNRQIFSEAEWKIDREGYCVRAKNCNGEYINDNLCIECKQLKSNTKLDNRIRAKKPDKKNLKFTPNCEDENIQLTIKNTRKRIPCPGLRSQKIRYYIERTPAQVGGTRRIEIIGKELFPSLFSDKFTRKKLNTSQKRKLNRQIFSEAEWKIDREGYCVRAKNCNGEYINDNLCIECKQLKSNTKLDNRLNGAFDNVDTFKGLCAVICQVINRKEEGKEMRNLQYSEEFTNFLIVLGTISPRVLELFRQNLVGRSIQNIRKLRANSSDTLTNPDLCFENVAQFKRFLDKINYKGPIAAMSNNTKLKPSLRYSSRLGCIIGSILSNEETKIQEYNDIPRIINSIKDKKAIANYVRVYILQIPLPKFSPVIIALIPNNGKDSADNIANIHKKLILEIVPQLNISILSIGSDRAVAEFGAQSIILNTKTDKKVEIIDKTLNINFNCPVFSNIEPVLRIQDLKHVKKTARNVVMSGARVLTFGKHIACFEHFLKLVNLSNSVLYNGDVIKLDRQDDRAAYRSFCHQNLAQCLNGKEIKEGYEGELVDSYLNREICPIERMRMYMIAYFFLRLWHFHIDTMTHKYPHYISVRKNFMATQSYSIFSSLSESMMILIKAHREYYSEFPLIPWMHGSEACYIFDYNKGNLTEDIISNLTRWPSDSEISRAIRQSRQLACELAEHLNMLMPDNLPIENLQPIVIIEMDNDPEISVSFFEDSNEKEFELNEINSFLQAISKASNEISSRQIVNYIENDDDINNINEYCAQINLLNQNIATSITSVSNIEYTGNDGLNYDFLIKQREKHEAYNSRLILRKLRTSNFQNSNSENSIQPNKASHHQELYRGVLQHSTNDTY
ncbi:hypothetical protein Glove_620g12 [Diversispora epigaea]|uniref:Uncharacterized protein n=1 Tax=Diversispora epigaea TaxID=1348612 RepID=A0A397GBY9_9GLOM|nr:hypothetical protein Glove_620g12 [Diversispora epigaea]